MDGIKADLTQGDDRPIWPLSAYGPGRDAPRQLLEGPLESSPEELRVQYYLAKAGGSTQQYEQNERAAVDQANQRIQQILNDVDGAIKYIIDGKDQHPNRDDQTQKNASSFNWTTKPSLNQPAATSNTSTAFGQPSAFGATASSTAFGKASTPGFGQASAPGRGMALGGGSSGGSTFGSASTNSTSAFGRPSGLGGASAFGQPSSLGGGSTAFGKPSGLGVASTFGGQSITSSTPFGQQSANTGPSPFGQASSTTGASAFGQTSSAAVGSTFGQASAPGSGTAFGQPSAPGSSTAFGKPSTFGAAASSAPAFGSSTPFGAAKSSAAPAFGQASQSTQQSSTSGQAAQPAQQQSNFGKPTAFESTGGTTATFGQPTFGNSSNPSAFSKPTAPSQQPSAFGAATTNGSTGAFGSQAQPSNAFGRTTSNIPGQRITNFKGRQVTYRPLEKKDGHVEDKKEYPFYMNPATNKQERVWLPDGAPGPNPDVEAPPETYEALGSALKQLYDFVLEQGTFKDGVMPEVPPKREWVNWEL